MIVYDPAGRLVHKWGTTFQGAHGLSLVVEGGLEILYLTDLKRSRVFKTTTSGELLDEWGWPAATGKYRQGVRLQTLVDAASARRRLFILDGYGRDYIARRGADGKFQKLFGGAEGGIAHWGPHGGMVDVRAGDDEPTLLIAMSDQQYLLRPRPRPKDRGADLPAATRADPGAECGTITSFAAHLASNWPKDRASRGFVSPCSTQISA